MFTEIEKQYQENLAEHKFWKFYFRFATPVILVATMVTFLLNLNPWLVTGAVMIYLLYLVAHFFNQEVNHILGRRQIHPSLRIKIQAYARADNEYRLNNLLNILHEHNIRTREDLELAIRYFEGRRPVVTKTSLLEWVLTIAITLASVVAIAYDDNSQAINDMKLFHILWPTFRIVLFVMVPGFVIGFISNKVFFSRSKVDSILIEDLSYIYVNYDKFQKKLKS